MVSGHEQLAQPAAVPGRLLGYGGVAFRHVLQDGAPGSTAADADDGGYGGAEGQVPSLQAPEAVRLAAQMVAAAVSERIQSGQVAGLPLEAADKRVSVGAGRV